MSFVKNENQPPVFTPKLLANERFLFQTQTILNDLNTARNELSLADSYRERVKALSNLIQETEEQAELEAEEAAKAEAEIEVEEGESLEEIKAKLKPKKASISLDMLDTANTYDDKVVLMRLLVHILNIHLSLRMKKLKLKI